MKKILIVEDDEILQRMYQKSLVSQGYEVVQAYEGKAGLVMVQETKPDLVLLDIMLPGEMNGFDVLEQIKKDDNLKNTLVLVVTNLDSEGKVAKEIGATGYLMKINNKPEQVVAAVKQLLATKKS